MGVVNRIKIGHSIPRRPFEQNVCVVRPLRGACAARQFPVEPNEMAGIAVRKTLQIILMFWLGFPQVAGKCHFRHHFTGDRDEKTDKDSRIIERTVCPVWKSIYKNINTDANF